MDACHMNPTRPSICRHGLLFLYAVLATTINILFQQHVLAAMPSGGNWPAWRGDGSGISLETRLPVTWDATNHIIWRTPLPGEGSSSPIVWDRRVFLTASTDHGTNRLVICLDSQNGRVLWQRSLPTSRIPRTDPKAGYAPATPATDGRRLYVFLDSPGLMAFDMDGSLLWTLPLGPFKSPYNITASPIVFRDRVIQCCDHAGEAFILAVDSATGALLWKTPRNQKYQYGTPLLIESGDAWQIVASASAVKSYDPVTGRELWSCAGLTDCVAPSPVYGEDGLVYATSGRNGPSLAIDPGGSGDVTESRVRMQMTTGGPYVPSPLFRSVLVIPADDGVLRLASTSGEMRVAERLRAHFTASPVIAGSNIYWTAESGDTYVLNASHLGDAQPELHRVSVNSLGEKCLASPAIAGGCLFIRTDQALYCISGTDAAAPTPLSHPVNTAGFAELKQRFESHPAEDGPDIPVRLDVVNALADLQSTQAVIFLKQIALKDPHWDVCEAAAKALGASKTPETIPALLALENDRRDYMKIISANSLGQLQAGDAVPLLLSGAHDPKPLVRIARLQALAAIASAPNMATGPILTVLQEALADPEGAVRQAAIQGLAGLAKCPGVDPGVIVTSLKSCLADPNPLVADTARKALQTLN